MRALLIRHPHIDKILDGNKSVRSVVLEHPSAKQSPSLQAGLEPSSASVIWSIAVAH